jgi:predicted nucleic acid-binding protein
MKVLVDTSIWSLALRRRRDTSTEAAAVRLSALVEEGLVATIGPIRQELLSGIRERSQFDRVREHLRAFTDTPLTSEDYEEAAAFFNTCRGRGVQGSNTDFLICATAVRNDYAIFTADADFVLFAKLLPIVLHPSAM